MEKNGVFSSCKDMLLCKPHDSTIVNFVGNMRLTRNFTNTVRISTIIEVQSNFRPESIVRGPVSGYILCTDCEAIGSTSHIPRKRLTHQGPDREKITEVRMIPQISKTVITRG